eukprot:9443824-Alexandrium_andersonii.AAC.1
MGAARVRKARDMDAATPTVVRSLCTASSGVAMSAAPHSVTQRTQRMGPWPSPQRMLAPRVLPARQGAVIEGEAMSVQLEAAEPR